MGAITLQGVEKWFGSVQVIKGVDLEIGDGEFVIFVGPSGCGKSTLLRMVAGLETVSEGVVEIDGERVNEKEPMDRDIAMVFQNYALYPHMSVRQNMAYSLKIAGMDKAEIERKVADAARLLQLEPYLDRKPKQLSGGQRQRVAMGRAIVREPSVFLFDEPLSNLDAKLRVQMRLEIRQLQAKLGVTSLYVTHDQVEAMTMADRMIVMNAGRAEQIGTPLEVYERPATLFAAQFIGSPAMNVVSGTLRAGRAVLPGGAEIACGTHHEGPASVGIRPESLHAGDDGPLDMTVDIAEPLGATTLLHGKLTGTDEDFTASLPGVHRLEAGTRLRLSVAPGAVHLFDSKTGLRID